MERLHRCVGQQRNESGTAFVFRRDEQPVLLILQSPAICAIMRPYPRVPESAINASRTFVKPEGDEAFLPG